MKKMLAKQFLSVAVLVVLCGGLEACPYISNGCSFDDSDCTSLTCTTSILGKTITTKIKLDTCKTDISATVTLDASGVHFTKTFYGKGDVPIPGLSFGPLGSANIRFRVYRSGSNVKLEVYIVVKTILTSEKSFKVISEDIGRAPKCSDWFSSQSDGIKALIIGGSIAIFLGIIGCIACCCCGCCGCCGCCKESTPGVVVARPFQPQPTQVVMENMPDITTPYKKF